MAIKLIIDSTIDLPLSDEIIVAPLTVLFGEKEYLDTIDITKDQFYDMLEKNEVLPKTSQVSPARFMDLFDEVTKNGDSAVVITISSKLSGTFQSAKIAATDYPNIRVVDSENVTIASGVLATLALNMIRNGLDLDEIYKCLEENKKRIRLIAVLDTLDYLHKGGRISKTAAVAGGILNIKPIITSVDGELKLIGKARGSNKANSFVLSKMDEMTIDQDYPVLAGYTGKDSTLLGNFLEESKSYYNTLLEKTQLGSIIGTHAGPGAYAIAYFEKGGKDGI